MFDSLFNSFFGQHQNQSAQSYSAAVARDLGLMNQYFTSQNMGYAAMLNAALMSKEGSINKSLARDQFDYQNLLNESAYGYDKALALLSHGLNTESADADYKRSVRYVGDQLRAYKKALIANGYNPLLALGSSAATYSGHTNPVGNLGAMSGGVAPSASVGGHSVNGGSPASGSGVGVPSASVSSKGPFEESINSAFDAAEKISRIKANESSSKKDEADAALSLEKAQTESNHRTDSGHKIQSETAKNYGNIATGVATGIGTAYGANKAVKVINAATNAAKRGNIASAVKTAASEIGSSANSANLGSKIIQATIPIATGAAVAVPTAKKGMEDAVKGAKSGDAKWYDNWRRVYFPMTGGF